MKRDKPHSPDEKIKDAAARLEEVRKWPGRVAALEKKGTNMTALCKKHFKKKFKSAQSLFSRSLNESTLAAWETIDKFNAAFKKEGV